jgi:hypothetical protein
MAMDPQLSGHGELVDVTRWEYLIVALPHFDEATTKGHSAAVDALNREGALGWEAFGMTLLDDGSVAVLLKRLLRGPSS